MDTNNQQTQEDLTDAFEDLSTDTQIQEKNDANEPEKRLPKKRRWIKWLLMICLILLPCGFGLFFFLVSSERIDTKQSALTSSLSQFMPNEPMQPILSFQFNDLGQYQSLEPITFTITHMTLISDPDLITQTDVALPFKGLTDLAKGQALTFDLSEPDQGMTQDKASISEPIQAITQDKASIEVAQETPKAPVFRFPIPPVPEFVLELEEKHGKSLSVSEGESLTDVAKESQQITSEDQDIAISETSEPEKTTKTAKEAKGITQLEEMVFQPVIRTKATIYRAPIPIMKMFPELTLDFGSFFVLLPENNSWTYINVGISLKTSNADVFKELQNRKIFFRSAIYSILNRLVTKNLDTPLHLSKETLKDDILSDLNNLLVKGRVELIYLTNFFSI